MTEPDVNDWELVVEARARRARVDLAALADHPEYRHDRDAAAAALDVVETSLHRPIRLRSRPSAWWTGWRVERAWRALHEAEVYLAAADPELVARLPALCERVAPGLPGHDLRRVALDALTPATPPTAADRIVVVDRLLDNYADRLLDRVRPLPRSGDS